MKYQKSTLRIIIALIVFITYGQLIAQPTITSFAPTSGSIGTTVTITGSGFDVTPENNIVFFGATQAEVSAATATDITVTVPSGANYQPITVLVDGLVAYASAAFEVSFLHVVDFNLGSFSDKTDFSTASDPFGVSIGDLDGDGKPDIAVANAGSASISIYRNMTTEAGVITYAEKVDFSTGTDPYSVAIGDLDGDGKPDLAVTNSGGATVSVLRNISSETGVIGFAEKIDFSTSAVPFSIAIGDLDNDGKSDLAIANLGSNSISVLRNSSTGLGNIGFDTKVDFTADSQPIDIAITDLDGDGKVDLGVANWGGHGMSLFRNTSNTAGEISFANRVDYATGTNARSISIGDLNGDKKPDLAVTNASNESLSVFRNTSTETGSIVLADKQDYATAVGAVPIAIADLDGDGKSDLAIASANDGLLSIYKNVSNPSDEISFESPVNYSTLTKAWAMAIGDVDADGKPDIAVVNYDVNGAQFEGHNTLRIHRNSPGEKFVSSNLPIVIINTHGASEITKERIGADMKIVWNPEARNEVAGPFNEYDGLIAIKGRGESSWEAYNKKGYTLETQLSDGSNNNVSLLGMPEENDWVLHGPFGDKTLMKNALVYNLGTDMGRYAPRNEFCELMINGEYRGVYLLVEKIKIDKNRVDIATLTPEEITGDDLTGGYLLRIDREQDEFWSPNPNYNFGYGISHFNYFSPDPAEMPQIQKDYIKDYVTDFEIALAQESLGDIETGYRSYVNLPSFIDHFIISELTKNIDAYRLSTYMYKDKDSKGGKLTMGPLWDYNLSCGGVNIGFGNWGATAENWISDELPEGVPFWWSKFLEDEYYNACLKKRWTDLKDQLINVGEINSRVDAYASLLDEAKDRNFQYFPLEEHVWGNDHIGFTYAEEIDTLKGFLNERIKWMDGAIAALPSNGVCEECFECAPMLPEPLASEFLNNPNFSIYPNPTTDAITARFILSTTSDVHFELHDLAGRRVKYQVFYLKGGSHDLQINLTDLQKTGTFIYKISTPTSVLGSGTLIKE